MMWIVRIGFIILLSSGLVWGGEVASRQAKPSPHGDNAQCGVCHVASVEDLNSWFTFQSTKKQLIADFNSLCRNCHGVEFGHGVGKKPALNRDPLPLALDGTIACAITCHNMHVKSDDPGQNRYHLRASPEKLCISCHNK